jgi:hypothetical protein
MAKAKRGFGGEEDVSREESPPPSGTRSCLGWIKDEPSEKDWNASALFGAPRASAIPVESYLDGYVRRVSDQSVTLSCVGQACGRAIDVRLRKLGFDGPEPSALGIYAGARQTTNGRIGRKDDPILDLGSYPRDAMAFVKEQGVPREEAWPFDPARVNERLKWHALQDASRFLLFRWWRIFQSGKARAEAVAQALAKGFPVIFGLQTDDAFFRYSDGVIDSFGSEEKGGHMLCCVGYRTTVEARREFLIVNSWGVGWGRHGYCWIGESAFGSDRIGDVYVIEVSS